MTRKTEPSARRRLFQRIGAGLLVLLAAFLLTGPGKSALDRLFALSGFGRKTEAPFAIHVLDVGKADAILIECQGRVALVDAGTALHGEMVVDYMARHRMGDRLDYVIASHPDSDHIGGIPQVLREVPCGAFIRSRYFDSAYERVNEVLREKSIPQRLVSPGSGLPLGDATLEVLGPLRSYDGTNNCSLVIRVRFREFSALLCGDIEEEAESDLVREGIDLSADLLKVAHHGSKTSSSEEFLRAVAPKMAVISTGPDNNNLPVESVLLRLENICQEVYRTDVDGTVVFSYEESGMNVLTEREGYH